jgi:ABC-type amino acid transport substrate-binding protein
LHDSGEAGGLPYYVMTYVEGESLRQIASGGGPEGTRLQLGMMIAPANERLCAAVNRALTGLKANGTWERLCRRWLSAESA